MDGGDAMGGELDRPEGIDLATTSGDPPRTPVVVVQHRRSWLAMLSAPLLILVASAAVLSHRVKLDDWRGLGDWLRSEPVALPVEPERRATAGPPLAVPAPVVLTPGSRGPVVKRRAAVIKPRIE